MHVRLTDGTNANPVVAWVGNFGTCRVAAHNKGNSPKYIINVYNRSTDNEFWVRALGTMPNPTVGVTSGLRNTFWTSSGSALDYDPAEFTPSSGNAVIFESAHQYQSSKNVGSGANPTTTFQLPKPGAYLVHVNLISSDKNHARAGFYWVVFDRASTNDFTTAQLIGTQIAKGRLAPTVLTLSVSNAGLCTIASMAGPNTYLLRYGYRQLSPE
jgi:hypothetical protein